MPHDELNTPSGRTTAQLLTFVRDSARQRRRRRLVTQRALPAAAAALLLVVGIAAVATGSDGNTDLRTADSGEDTSPTTDTTADTAPTTTTEQQPATTTAPPATTSTTVKGAAVPAPTTTSTTEPAATYCTAAELKAAASTDRASYRPGQPVKVTTTITNTSNRPCLLPHGSAMSVRDSEGNEVEGFAASPPSRVEGSPEPQLAPGEAASKEWGWDQQTCTQSGCQQAPLGNYSARVYWTSGNSTITADTPSFTLAAT